MAIAGRVAIVPKGDYDSTVAYQKLDLVRYNHNVYIAKKSSTGILPTDEEYWMLAIENVTQEQYEAIVNGTTTVGNANKLGGKSASEYALVKELEDYIPTILRGTTEAEIDTIYANLHANSADGTHYEKRVAHGYSHSVLGGGEYFVEGVRANPDYGWQRTTAYTNSGYTVTFEREIAKGVWGVWKKANDGGNADTVDGKHASEFMIQTGGYGTGIHGSYDLNTWTTRGTYCVEYSCTNVPPDTDGWGNVLVFGGMGTRVTQLLLPWNSFTHLHFRTNAEGTWSEWRKIAITDDLANYLPLNGSVPMSGSLRVSGGFTQLHGSGTGTSLTAYNNKGATSRILTMYTDSDGNFGDAKNCLLLTDVVGGANYTVLHTGNSQKVVTSASAPSDTTAVWIDSANKVSKIYIDGAWTAMA